MPQTVFQAKKHWSQIETQRRRKQRKTTKMVNMEVYLNKYWLCGRTLAKELENLDKMGNF